MVVDGERSAPTRVAAAPLESSRSSHVGALKLDHSGSSTLIAILALIALMRWFIATTAVAGDRPSVAAHGADAQDPEPL